MLNQFNYNINNVDEIRNINNQIKCRETDPDISEA